MLGGVGLLLGTIMTAHRRDRGHLLFFMSAAALVSSAGCSLLYDLNTTQCETSDDCRALGEAFANTTCYNRVCVERSPTGGEGGTEPSSGGAAGTGGRDAGGTSHSGGKDVQSGSAGLEDTGGAGGAAGVEGGRENSGGAQPSGGGGASGSEAGASGTGGVATAGQGGEAAGTGGSGSECDTNAECIEQHQDQFFICKNHECVALVTDECPELIPESTAQWTALEALRKYNPIVLGAYSVMNSTTPHESTSVLNWELALTEFNEKLLGGLASGSSRRPLMAVACQAQDPDLEASMGHLVGKLDVPAILTALSSDDLLAALELTDPDGQDPVFFMSALSADLRLATLQDNGMLWHMLGNPRILAAPMVALLKRVEPYVNAQRQTSWDARATTGSTDDPGTDPLRVMLIYSDYPVVEDIATVLTTADDKNPQNTLFFNAKTAIDPDNAESFNSVKIQSSRLHASPDQDMLNAAVAELQSFLPHIIVAMATTEFSTSLIPPIELNWEAWTQGQQRPFYLLSHMLYNQGSLLTHAGNSFKSVGLGSRMVGINYALNPDDALYQSYLTRLKASYPASTLPGGLVLDGTENFYDAAYYLLYSVAAANRTTYTGEDIRDALTSRVVFGAEPLDIGPAFIAAAVRNFRDDPGYSIQLTATMGPPNFDRATGTRISKTAAWCVGQATPEADWQFMTDVSLFDDTNYVFDDQPIVCVDGL